MHAQPPTRDPRWSTIHWPGACTSTSALSAGAEPAVGMTSTSGARERRSARARGEHALCAGTCARRKRLSLRAGRALTKRALAREEVSRPLPRPCTKGLRRERGRTPVPATQRDRQSRHFRLGGGSRGMDTASSRLSRRASRGDFGTPSVSLGSGSRAGQAAVRTDALRAWSGSSLLSLAS